MRNFVRNPNGDASNFKKISAAIRNLTRQNYSCARHPPGPPWFIRLLLNSIRIHVSLRCSIDYRSNLGVDLPASISCVGERGVAAAQRRDSTAEEGEQKGNKREETVCESARRWGEGVGVTASHGLRNASARAGRHGRRRPQHSTDRWRAAERHDLAGRGGAPPEPDRPVGGGRQLGSERH